jgi:Aldo/keto reductase family
MARGRRRLLETQARGVTAGLGPDTAASCFRCPGAAGCGASTEGYALDLVWPKGGSGKPALPEPRGFVALLVQAGTHAGSALAWRPMNEPGTERPLGRSRVSVPALGVGTNRWNCDTPDQARLGDTLAAALDVGTGFFDTAEVYNHGRSEIALGRL